MSEPKLSVKESAVTQLYLVTLDTHRGRLRGTLAVLAVVEASCESCTLVRVADLNHELTTAEVDSLERAALHKAVLAAEWQRRTPRALRGGPEDQKAHGVVRGRGVDHG